MNIKAKIKVFVEHWKKVQKRFAKNGKKSNIEKSKRHFNNNFVFMERHKKIWKMYWVLLAIKEEYLEKWWYEKLKITFAEYSTQEVEKLHSQAFEWIIEDERESNDKVSQ